MIDALRNLFTISENTAEKTAADIDERLAAAALMVEVMVADDHLDDQESAALKQILQKQFQMTESEARTLFSEALKAHDAATDYFAFTRQINAQFSMPEKIRLIERLWQMAAADDVIEAVEQHVIRRIASLLHVSHSDFIAAKLKMTDE